MVILAALVLAPPALTSIRIERTPCFGTCPSYRATLYADGRIVYYGREFVPHKGEHKLKNPWGEIPRLGRMAEKLGFFSLKARYESNRTDLPSTTIEITRGKEVKNVYCYGDPPDEIWMLATAIDKVIDDAFKKEAEPKIDITVRKKKG